MSKKPRLTQAQMDSDQGYIHGRVDKFPGARYDGECFGYPQGTFFDQRGYQCVLPGASPVEKISKKPEPPKEVELTDEQVALNQLDDYLDTIKTDDDKNVLIAWASENLGVKYRKDIALPTLKKNIKKEYVSRQEQAAKDNPESDEGGEDDGSQDDG